MRLSVTRAAKICPTEIAANISPCVTGKIAQLLSRPYFPNYSFDFPAAFTFAHLALANAANLALPAALIFFFAAVPLIFAHLAR
jgi:hypothetical protein